MGNKTYRLYIDESGDHTFQTYYDSSRQYLGITGVVVNTDYYKETFHPSIESLKQRYFPHNPDDPIILHRKEIINTSGPFFRLKDERVRLAFNDDLLSMVADSAYCIISVLIDKKAQVERYGEAAFHPYHYCLAALLERYCGYLNFYNAAGDVVAEARGGKEDMQLKAAYRSVYESGTQFRQASFFQSALTSKEIKIKSKASNILGLQFADLLASPCRLEILEDNGRNEKELTIFTKQMIKAMHDRYNCHAYSGSVDGYGKVFIK